MTLDTNKTNEKLTTTIEQEYKILAEYKMIESEKIGGIYVIPSFGNSLLWYGVIFVRQGFFYSEAIFRFTILLPDKFPDDKTLPTIIFQNEIVHPLICPYTGTLDISQAFPQWRTGEDHLWQLLKYIQAIFYDPTECLGNSTTSKFSNAEAAELLTQNRAEYIARIKKSIALSKEHIYDAPPTEDPHYIVFEKFDDDVHAPVIENIRLGKDTTSSTAVSANGLSWVKEGEFKPLSVE